MIERSVSARSAKSVFFEDFNDIDVYIEDTAVGYRKIFKELLIRVFDNIISLEQVFPLGNREQVIEECKKNQSNKKRKQLYIIDGDLHLLCGTNPVQLKGLFVLPRYCVENYFMDKTAIIDTIDEEDPDLEKNTIEVKLDFDNWIKDNDAQLIKLFIFYALCFKYIPSLQTVGYKVSNLCSSNNGVVCSQKIALRINDLNNKLLEVLSAENIEREYRIFFDKINIDNVKVLRYVSAKDYLMPLLTTKIRSFAKFPPNDLSTKIRLARKVDVSELNDIKEYILN
ncbi:MAG: DUF4435 domain-containing protein [Prevotella sp.]|jgi:hypothetical protein|nr:DUF4435 domain-containing protein [Prevotella sp.]